MNDSGAHTKSLKEKLLERMQELELRPKRALGQNFLIDSYVVSQIVKAVNALPVLQIIEIGPGLGALTDELIKLERDRILIEFDRKFAAYWRSRGENVIENDALKMDWSEHLKQDDRASKINKSVLVSNLPYQIASRIVVERSFDDFPIPFMVLMFQREVADRLVASARSAEYGLLSVIAQAFWTIEKVVDASPECFYPKPNVSSRVLKFARKKEVASDRKFLAFIKQAFQYRRKLLVKNLKSYEGQVRGLLTGFGLSETARPEELTVDQYLALFNKIAGG